MSPFFRTFFPLDASIERAGSFLESARDASGEKPPSFLVLLCLLFELRLIQAVFDLSLWWPRCSCPLPRLTVYPILSHRARFFLSSSVGLKGASWSSMLAVASLSDCFFCLPSLKAYPCSLLCRSPLCFRADDLRPRADCTHAGEFQVLQQLPLPSTRGDASSHHPDAGMYPSVLVRNAYRHGVVRVICQTRVGELRGGFRLIFSVGVCRHRSCMDKKKLEFFFLVLARGVFVQVMSLLASAIGFAPCAWVCKAWRIKC